MEEGDPGKDESMGTTILSDLRAAEQFDYRLRQRQLRSTAMKRNAMKEALLQAITRAKMKLGEAIEPAGGDILKEIPMAISADESRTSPHTHQSSSTIPKGPSYPIQDIFEYDGDDTWQHCVATEMTIAPEDNQSPVESPPTQPRISDTSLRRLIKGKTMEALSFILGSAGLKVEQYQWIADTVNCYATRLGEDKFPCYKTLLYNSMKILQSVVFVRNRGVEAAIDVYRAGVQQRFIEEHQKGGQPKVDVMFIHPSDWAAKDVVLFNYMTAVSKTRRRIPRIVSIDSSALVYHDAVNTLTTSLQEIIQEKNGYTSGRDLKEGTEILITLLDPRAPTEIGEHPDISIEQGIRRRRTVLRGLIGSTRFAAEHSLDGLIHPL